MRLGQNRHNKREARTIVEVCDLLLKGQTLSALVVLIGRLRALTAVVMPEGQTGGWSVAQHYEILQSSQTGLLTNRDRRNALLDQRDAQRALSLVDRRGRDQGAS